MTQPTLPPDIAEAIEAFDGWARSWGYQEDQGVGSDVARTMAEYERARAALEAVILGHLGGEWREIDSAPKDGTDLLAYWLRRRPNGERYEAHQPYVIAHHYRGDFYPLWLRKDPPTHWRPLPSPPATDIGRSALAEEGRGE